MKYPKELYQQCDQIFLRRRLSAESMLEERKQRSFGLVGGDKLRFLEKELAKASLDLVRRTTRGENLAALSKALGEKAQNLKMQSYETLTGLGLPADYLEIVYNCPKCHDTGFVEGTLCTCYEQELKKLSFSRLPLASTPMTFENFDLSYYPERLSKFGVSERLMMQRNLEMCKFFVSDFRLGQHKSLLLFGATGLGKTHLSTAIAKKLVDRGHFVIIDMAATIFTNFEHEKFGRKSEMDTSLYTSCDLLVVDDLGSEYTTPFVVAALFTLINARQLAGLSTIVSTNLSLEQLKELYGEKVSSRLIGEFTPLNFLGTDIRMTKRTGAIQ